MQPTRRTQCRSAPGFRDGWWRGAEPQQLKWFAYGAALVFVLPVASVAGVHVAGLAGRLLPTAIFSALPVTIGIAVLRYRLYDIDRLINRTVVYGLLTILLGGLYAAMVLTMGQLAGRIGADPPSWAVAGVTLAAAALFQPARRRIQGLVDGASFGAAMTLRGW